MSPFDYDEAVDDLYGRDLIALPAEPSYDDPVVPRDELCVLDEIAHCRRIGNTDRVARLEGDLAALRARRGLVDWPEAVS